MPAACMHGAIIYDKDRNIEQSTSLDPHFVRDVSRLMRAHNKSTFLYVEDWNAMVTKEENGTKDWETVARGFDPEVRDERNSDFMQRVLKKKEVISKVCPALSSPASVLVLTFFSLQIFLPMDEEVVPSFIDLIEKEFANVPFKITRALPYIIEIVAEGVDKSAALAFFCAKFDIRPENVLTFGDGENECVFLFPVFLFLPLLTCFSLYSVGMFAASGHSVAMANGMPKPKQVAKYQTSSNNDGGVGEFLNAVFRPQRSDVSNAGLSVDHLNALDSSVVGASPLSSGAFP
jgi:hydroxymethylpyrimidine pyrophosphatase-like HAD family hydrolase